MGSISALNQWVKAWGCHKLQCRLQMLLRSGVAVAVVWACSYSSNSTPSLGTSIGHRGSRKKKEKKKKPTENKLLERMWENRNTE